MPNSGNPLHNLNRLHIDGDDLADEAQEVVEVFGPVGRGGEVMGRMPTRSGPRVDAASRRCSRSQH